VARLRTTTATSAGGVVVRFDSGRPQFVVGMRRRERGGTWTLPKGTPTTGETMEETAVREVGEETGLDVRITEPLGSTEKFKVS
jgi:8-oxo-dGTP pyrophosphatase MutT (NUDIX family)